MKKRYVTILCVLLAVLGLCTYISGQVYYKNLPVVETARPINTRIRYQWELSGNMYYKEPLNYSATAPVKVVRILAEPGMWVESETAVLQLDLDYVRQEWLKAKLEEETLTDQLRGIEPEWEITAEGTGQYADQKAVDSVLQDGDSREWLIKEETEETYELSLLLYQYQTLQEKISQLEQYIAWDGFLYTEQEGLILSVANLGLVSVGANLVSLGTAEGIKEFVFALNEQQAGFCNTAIKLKIDALEESLTVERVYYQAAKGQYQCVVTTRLPVKFMDGHPVTASLDVSTEPYEAVLPVSAVVKNDKGNASFFVLREREGILGKEYYAVHMSGLVPAYNEAYVALSSPVYEEVIVNFSEPLYDGCVVRLK